MSIVYAALDGSNIALEIIDPETSVDLLSMDLSTGAASSAYLPDAWLELLERRFAAFVASAGALFDLDERRRGALNFLQRFVNISPLDDSTLGLSVVNTGDVYTLVAAVSASTGNPAHLIVNLPHSISGAVAVAGGVTGPAATSLSGVVQGLPTATAFAPNVIPYDFFVNSAGTYSSNEVIARYQVPRALRLSGVIGDPALPNTHSLTAGSAATATSVVLVKADATTLLTCTFAAGSATASIVVNETAVPEGAAITVQMPATADATLADITGTICGAV